jgi:hypothetical protein
MKQTKASLVDFVDGPWLLSRDSLYKLRDGMHMEPAKDDAERSRLSAAFAAFRAANADFARTLALMPPPDPSTWISYAAPSRHNLPPPSTAPVASLAVRDVQAPEHAQAGQLSVEVVIANGSRQASGMFVPLVVLQSADGVEISETYAPAQALAAGQTVTLQVPVKSDGVAAGRYYLSVFPSDPATGKRSGDGRFRIPVAIGN